MSSADDIAQIHAIKKQRCSNEPSTATQHIDLVDQLCLSRFVDDTEITPDVSPDDDALMRLIDKTVSPSLPSDIRNDLVACI